MWYGRASNGTTRSTPRHGEGHLTVVQWMAGNDGSVTQPTNNG